MNLTKEQALAQIENLKKFVEDLDKPKLPELINGHWYTPTESDSYRDSVYVYVSIIDTLVNLEGGVWEEGHGFNDEKGIFGWEDVTRNYKIVRRLGVE